MNAPVKTPGLIVEQDGRINFPPQDVRGSGGGGKGGGSVESASTYRTNNIARMIELLGEGEIFGLVDGAKSIYFDQTPLQNENGSYNFRGVEWEERKGLPDQAALEGNTAAETPVSVETRVRVSTGAVVRTIVETNATAARVVIRVPALSSVDKEGNIKASAVSFMIERRSYGGAWEQVKTFSLREKFTSPCQFPWRVTLPEGGAPWDIRVTRITADSTSVKIADETWWESYTILVENRFIYPNSALVSLRVNAALFSQSSIPTRFFRVKGLILDVPSNYDSTTRVYTGLWNGTFQRSWTNNPAWIFYALLRNDRWGLGEFINAATIDKWTLYQIAQYCDELVPDGFGGTEPRYTFNGVINTRQEAFRVLQQITTAFRGMAFWSLGQVFAFADMPEDATTLVTPANVIKGEINYPGTSIKARHSVVMVTWNDPQDFGRPAVEVVIDEDLLYRYGWRETQIQAIGCTSRGLARRYGKWVLETEKGSSGAIEYAASWDHAQVRPGNIIAVADPRKAQVRAGGRLVSVAGAVLEIDAPFEMIVGETYKMTVTLPDGTIDEKDMVTVVDKTVTLVSAFATSPLPGSVFVITGTDVAPAQYRVLAVNETEPNIFKIIGVSHDPLKFAKIEQNILLEPIAYTRRKRRTDPVTGLAAVEEISYNDGQPSARITLSWTPPADLQYAAFWIYADTPRGFQDFGRTIGSSLTIENTLAGDYTFYVVAIGHTGVASVDTSLAFAALGWAATVTPSVQDLKVFGRTDLYFTGRDARITWRNVFPVEMAPNDTIIAADDTGLSNPFYHSNTVVVRDADTNVVLHTETVNTNSYTYTHEKNTLDGGPRRRIKFEVTLTDKLERVSAAVSATVENLKPASVVPVVSSGVRSLFVTWTPPVGDTDIAGARVWVSQTNNFDPNVVTPVYEGPDQLISIPVIDEGVYYVRIALFDAFDKVALNISAQVTHNLADPDFIDQTAPATPVGLSLTTGIETLASGEINTWLQANWTSTALATTYDIEIKPTGGNFVSSRTALNSFRWNGLLPNTSYTVRLRGLSQLGFPSGYTADSVLTSAQKTTAPAAPTSLTATASLKSAFLKWTLPADKDVAYVNVYRHTANVSGSAVLIGSSMGESFTDTGLTTGTAYYYWVKAVNTSGVLSVFSTGTTVTPGVVANGDIAANTITGDRVQAGTIDGDRLNISTSLPPTITVGVTGVTIGTVETRAAAGNNAWGKFTGAGNTIPSGNVEFNFANSTTKGGNALNTDAVGSQSALTVQTSVINFNANNDRIATTPTAPAIPGSGACLDHVLNTNGSADISFEWTFTNGSGANDIDGFLVFVRSSTSNSAYTFGTTAAEETVYYVTPDRRALILSGVAPDLYYTFGVQAYRIVDTDIDSTGFKKSAIVKSAVAGENPYQPTATVAFAGNITGTVNGVAAATVTSNAALGAQDPGTRINAGATTIDPGKILISGATTLSNWRNGSDNTKIEGGSIAANTVNANVVKIGLRGIDVAGIQFSYNKTTNVLSWTAGVITYTNDSGTITTASITAGSTTWTTGTLYIAWLMGATALIWSTSPYSTATHVTLATYRGSNDLVANYGRTIIDGANILTGSIVTNTLAAGAVEAVNIGAGAVVAGKIGANAVTATEINVGTLDAISANVGTLTAGILTSSGVDPKVYIDLTTGVLKAIDGEFSGKLGAVTMSVGENMYLERGAKILDGQWPPWPGFFYAIPPNYVLQIRENSLGASNNATGEYYFTGERALIEPYPITGTATTTATWFMNDGTVRTTANTDTVPTSGSTIVAFFHPLDFDPGFYHLAFPQKMFFPSLGYDRDFKVPPGTTKISVKLWGAAGGVGINSAGQVSGAGGYVAGTIAVTPGDKIRVQVGAGGSAASCFIYTSTSVFSGFNRNYAGAGVGRFGNFYRASGGGRTGVFRVEDDGSLTPLFIAAGGGAAENGINGTPGGVDGLYGSYYSTWAGAAGVGEDAGSTDQGGGGGGWKGGFRTQGGANYIDAAATGTTNSSGTTNTPPNVADADYVEFVNRTSSSHYPGRGRGLNNRAYIIHTAASASNGLFGNGGLAVLELLNT